jgi:hypothetical protein
MARISPLEHSAVIQERNQLLERLTICEAERLKAIQQAKDKTTEVKVEKQRSMTYIFAEAAKIDAADRATEDLRDELAECKERCWVLKETLLDEQDKAKVQAQKLAEQVKQNEDLKDILADAFEIMAELRQGIKQ